MSDFAVVPREAVEYEDGELRPVGDERAAFMAGWEEGLCGGHGDAEQAWQQYRCRDPRGFRAVPAKDAK